MGEQDGTSFLVMQYLEGETLAKRLEKGALPLDQALQYAIQVADALDKAHRAGIVHRDLKPANVMLTKMGAKLLDFGLAKTGAPTAAGAGLSMLPTTPANLTAQGTILGTFQYMAPEQLEGQEAEARTDIFAFGAVIYEMLTGRKAFEGKTQASLIAAILDREPPPIAASQPLAPASLDRVVKKCLAKEPDERWQSAKDLHDELLWLLEPVSAGQAPMTDAAPGRAARPLKLWMTLAVAFGLMAVASIAVQVYQYRSAALPEVVRFSIPPPDKTTFATGGALSAVASGGIISPDGRKFAFTARDASGKILLWVRLLDALVAEPLAGTEDAGLPFWSPDSRWIGFFAQGKLKKVDITAGSPQVLCDALDGLGGTWNRDGVIIFAPNRTGGLSRVRSAGGEPVGITKVNTGQTGHQFPFFLPDGRHFLYYVLGTSSETTGIFVGALDSGGKQRLFPADSPAIYAPPGHLLFVHEGTLLAQPFDTAKLQPIGDPIRLAELVGSPNNSAGFSASDTGVLTYRTGLLAQDLQFAWFDRTGKLLESVGASGNYHGMDLSLDGKRVAVHRHDSNGGDVWILEPRGTTTRFTFDASQENSSPIWSPDGRRIVFGSVRGGKWGLYAKSSNGTGGEELLVESELRKIPAAWSPDGKYLAYWLYDPKTGTDQWLLPMTGDRKLVPLLNSPFNESHAQISPDGKWIAYNSNQTGRNEVYVKPFPVGEGRWQISITGGLGPRWRGDGKELFYFSAISEGKLVAVMVNGAGSTFEADIPRDLFDTKYEEVGHVGFNYHVYAVSSDGQRFLIPRPASNLQGEPTGAPITVVLNWTAALKK